ncbi:MAG: branched-chain amino acid transport system substrate-binding protein [Alphaproteobacteria bacterium]|nr:branched-chain amino acid transport system substrate-binding protein [Alphaproteobacteria bacterium]
MNKKLVSAFTALLVGASAFTLLLSPAAAQESIRIGVVLPFTGPFAKGGLEDWTAMEIARDMINEKGGINGRKIEYLRGDAVNPNAAISEAERLITQDGVKITTGSFASPFAIAVSQTAERHTVLHWETVGAADTITKRGFKYTFQVGAPASRYGRAAVDFTRDVLAEKLGKPAKDVRVALLWENRAFGKSVGDGVRAYAKDLGLTMVFDDSYDQFATDMTPIVQKLKDTKPDVLIAISFLNDAVLFQRKAQELNFDTPVMMGVSAGYSAPELKDSLGNSVNGIFVADFPARVNPKALTPTAQGASDEFYKRYEQKQNRVAAGHSSATFSAMWLLFTEVMPKAKTMEAAELRDIALALDLPEGSLVNGSGVKFTNFDWDGDKKDAGQNLRSSIGVWQWQELGAWQVFPKALATREPLSVPLPAWDKR